VYVMICVCVVRCRHLSPKQCSVQSPSRRKDNASSRHTITQLVQRWQWDGEPYLCCGAAYLHFQPTSGPARHSTKFCWANFRRARWQSQEIFQL